MRPFSTAATSALYVLLDSVWRCVCAHFQQQMTVTFPEGQVIQHHGVAETKKIAKQEACAIAVQDARISMDYDAGDARLCRNMIL